MEIKFDTGDLFSNGENYRGKTPLDEFKVTTPENSLLSKQAVISKVIPVPYNEMTISSFNAQLQVRD